MTVNDELPATDQQKFNRWRVGVIFCKKFYLDEKSKRENAESFNLRRCDGCKYLEKKVLPRFLLCSDDVRD